MAEIDALCYRVADLFEPDPPITFGEVLEQLQMDAPALDGGQLEDLAAAIVKARDVDQDPLNVARKADLVELPGKAVLWFSDGDELHTADLPEDGGPNYAKCAACAAWLWLPDPALKGGVVICTGGYHDDAELEALGFEL